MYKIPMVISSPFSLYHANGSTAGYDNLNQLTAFARGNLSDTNSDGIPDTIATNSQSQAWATDGQGNFTSVTTNGTAQTRTYDQQNELTAVGSTSLSYDAAGNLKTDDLNRTNVYDGWGQLISVSVPGNSSSILASYTYDALGHRITETSGGITKHLYYSRDWQVIEERVSNIAQAQYVWSPVYVDAMIERDQDTDANGTLDQRLYVQTDANFNVTTITDASGGIYERYQYDPYGKVTVLGIVYYPQGSGYSGDGWGATVSSYYGWQYFHQGGRQDTATGLLNFRNRDYSTSLMRWTSNDPLGFGGGDTNTYRYVGNGPGNGLDPSGLEKAPYQPNEAGTGPAPKPKEQSPFEKDIENEKNRVAELNRKFNNTKMSSSLKEQSYQDNNWWYPGKYWLRYRQEYCCGNDLDKKRIELYSKYTYQNQVLEEGGHVPSIIPGRWEISICNGLRPGIPGIGSHCWIELRGASPENAGEFYTITNCNFERFIGKSYSINLDKNNQGTTWAKNSKIVDNPIFPDLTYSWTCAGYCSCVWSINTGEKSYSISNDIITLGIWEQLFTLTNNWIHQILNKSPI